MKKIKDKLYDYFVRKNGRVWYEYERYVREHIEEHHLHRFRHLRVLFQLNWFYRIKKGSTPYLYWDEPLNSVHNNKRKNQNVQSESITSRKLDEYRMMKRFLEYDVISFDVFDTLLLRPFSDPYDSFILLQKKYGIVNFEKIRKNAVRSAFERKKLMGYKEITIRDIYEEINRQTGIPVEDGINNEIQLEKDLCFANDYIKTVLELLKEQNKIIIAVSDMYLSQGTIEELLKINGYPEFDNIFVSSEFGYGKKDGLFLNVKNAYKGKKIVHIGDNKEKDYEMPQKEGIDAYLYRSVNYMGKDKRSKGISGVIGSAYKGIVNSELYSGNKKYNLPYEYGFIYGGIYILGFTNWIIELKNRLDADKVFFLARDGYILDKVYKDVFKKDDSEYVFWSRLAGIRICAEKDKYTFIQDTLRKRIKDDSKLTVQQWLDAMGLSDISMFLSDYFLKADYPLVEVNINKLEKLLDDNWKYILKIYEKEEKAAKEYFEKLVKNSKCILLVDVGWQGQSMLMLKWLLEEKWKLDCRVECTMVASYPNDETANQVMLLDEKLNIYSFSLQKNKDIYRYFRKNKDITIKSWFEFFTQAPHPTFEKFYFDDSEKVKYKFGFPEVENYEFINSVHKGIFHFCELYYQRFQKYPFMLQISGADALVPFMFFMENKQKVIETFQNVNFPLDTFSSAINVKPLKAINKIKERN